MLQAMPHAMGEKYRKNRGFQGLEAKNDWFFRLFCTLQRPDH
jgi:hypothetical protein